MKYINVPGLFNSGPFHWQSLWEKRFADQFARVRQDNWNEPDKASWVKKLQETFLEQEEPFVAVAHSLGCITFVHWAAQYHNPMLAGALLVAPADVEKTTRSCLAGFGPVPSSPLPCPSITIASANDPYASACKIELWSKAWGSQFVNIGHKGHINADSGLGIWNEGLFWLEKVAEHQAIIL